MNVYASANAAVTTGVGITTGNIEFWPSNYGRQNDANVPGADPDTYDFGDGGFNATSAGHGSMQVHNYGEGHTIMSMISFGSNNRTPGLGIGNNPVWTNNDPDWTFTANAASYTTKNIYVLVRDGIAESPDAPRILTQPASLVVDLSAPALFNVYSPDATSYQWRKNGVIIPGATSSWLEIPSASLSDIGTYDVLAINENGATQSSSVTFVVVPQGTVIIVR
jgi:hypothetical protein